MLDKLVYIALGILIATLVYTALDRRNDASICTRHPDACEVPYTPHG